MSTEPRSGATDSPKKKGNTRTKLAWDALRLMEQLGCKTTEEFEQKLAALRQTDLPALEAEAPMTVIEEAVTADGPVEDCLSWIEDQDAIWLVSKSMSLSLRPSKPYMDPPLEQINISAARRAAWPNMPFDVRGKSDRETLMNRVNYSEWCHFVVSRDLAEQCYTSKAFPLPTEAVIAPQEFRGWGTYSQTAAGKKRSLGSPDPLRECVRRVLQRFPGRVFINSRHHPFAEWPTPEIANPYGNSLGNLRIIVQRTTTADKDIPMFVDKE